MSSSTRLSPFICGRCLFKSRRTAPISHPSFQKVGISDPYPRSYASGGKDDHSDKAPAEPGAMSRRLEEMTDQSIQDGGRRAKKAIHDGAFSDDLKKRLEQRLMDSEVRPLDSTASTVLSMPASAGQGTRDTAMAKPWTGNETLEDASLRMLTDAHKPLRPGRTVRKSPARLPAGSVDARMKQAVKASSGERLASARDRTSMYAFSQDPTLSEKEKEEMRRILKERFQPGARPMPTTIQGLASLANERIENAIARGQFKNIPRGKGVNQEVDYNANSPFINTTEYFMNKMIQRQEIVPPWIEKQQEVIKAAQTFRSRLRNEWKRHAARMIASKGGSLSEQIRRAEAYAVAEARLNSKSLKVESISHIDGAGSLSRANTVEASALAEDIGKPASASETNVTEAGLCVAATADNAVSEGGSSKTEADIKGQQRPSPDVPAGAESGQIPAGEEQARGMRQALPSLPPFRDPAWESIELAYHGAALKELNTLTRSYNLMAPELAKKPYYSLERELASCFADVAPQLPEIIKERARRPEKIRVEIIGHKPGSVLERFAGETAKVYDSKKPHYGFRQFWQELWNKDEERRV